MSENTQENKIRGYAVIDTETSGLFDFAKPADAEGQPRLAAFAMILLDADLKEETSFDYFVKPDGWELGEEAAKINGLTMKDLKVHGAPVVDVLKIYTDVIDQGYVIVAFNAQFDTKVMRGELRRANIDDRFEATPNICVMRASTQICKVPKAKGGGYKFPKLSEACSHFLISQDEDHSAMGDARAALAIFRKLRELGACPDPEVHYAKESPAKAGVIIPPPIEHAKPETFFDKIERKLSNNPPSTIDYARETIADLSAWMADHPVIETHDHAAEAKKFKDRVEAALKDVEAERDGKVRPLNETVANINAKYKALHNLDPKKPGTFDKVFGELKLRLAGFLKAEEDRRLKALEDARKQAAEAERLAREAEARELEALANAAVGEVGVDVAGVTAEADKAFQAFEKQSRFATIAERDTKVRIGGGFGNAVGLRTKKTLVLKDLDAAIKAIGLTEGIREAVLSSARDYRKLRGELPLGVVEVEEKVL